MKKEIDELVDVDAEETKTAPVADDKVGRIEKEMGELKSDVKKISEDLKRVVTELQKSIVEVRSAVSEIENPFNLLRVISSEKDLQKMNGERFSKPKPEMKTLVLGKPEREEKIIKFPSEDRFEERQTLAEEKQAEEEKTSPPIETQTVKLSHLHSTHGKGSAYLDWVWSLIEAGLTPDDIMQLAKSYEFMGYLPVNSSDHMRSIAVAAEKTMTKGFGKKRLLVNMYKAATMSGVQISLEDILELISIAERRMKHRTRNVSQKNGTAPKNGTSQRNGSSQRDV